MSTKMAEFGAARRTSAIESRSPSVERCEQLRRNTDAPASTKERTPSSDADAGPNVATIFVLRSTNRLFFRSTVLVREYGMALARNATQTIVTLDLEGVLVPEIWIAVAESTGIPELRRTTRDEPDYDKLMQGRLSILDAHGLTMSAIEGVIAGLSPLEGARDFLDELRSRTQVVILSDTFEQFGRPLMRHLGMPTLVCHRLVVDNDRIVDYELRLDDQKRRAVEALQGLNYRVIAAGDSYNDTAMLGAAQHGFLFHAPDNVKREFPQFPALDSYDDLLAHIVAVL
jgi:phosphoserine/homoserine phosphotransferase